MAILQKNNNGMFQSVGKTGEIGTWVDSQTGLGYSGPKRKPTDVPYQSNVGQQQNLNQNPQNPVRPQQTYNAPTIPIIPQQGPTPGAPESPQTPQYSPIDKFNMAILDMLQKAQNNSGNEDLYKRQRELQRKQIESSIDYSGTEGLSPQSQERIAQARGGEYTDEIDAVGAKIKANDARLQNFESILGTMKGIGQDIAKLSPSQEVIDGYKKMVEAGGSVTSIPEEVRAKVLPLIDWKAAQTAGKSASGLTAYQQEMMDQKKITIFNSISDKYNKSPLIAAADRASTTASIADTLEKNPKDRQNQLIALYQFIQILDNYQSAVREGEIGFVNGASSLQEKIETGITKLQSGQVLNPSVVVDIVKGIRTLTSSINAAASRKAQQYKAQAKTAGIEDLWTNYTSEFDAPYNEKEEEWEYIPDEQTNLFNKKPYG